MHSSYLHLNGCSKPLGRFDSVDKGRVAKEERAEEIKARMNGQKSLGANVFSLFEGRTISDGVLADITELARQYGAPV